MADYFCNSRYGLNGCTGRMTKNTPMDFTNIKQLIAATAASPHWRKGFYGFEFTNEIVNAQVSAEAWGADAATLRRLIVAAFPSGEAPPLIGPDNGDESPDLKNIVAATPAGSLYALSYHEYPQCIAPPGGTAGSWVVLDIHCLQGMDAAAAKFSAEAAAQPGLRVWSGEGADHGGGGVSGLTDTFRDSFYYAWRLGALPAAGVELAIRQCFTGGDCEILYPSLPLTTTTRRRRSGLFSLFARTRTHIHRNFSSMDVSDKLLLMLDEMIQHAAGFAPNPDFFVRFIQH